MPATTEEAIRRKRENYNKKRRKTNMKGRCSGSTPGNNLMKDLLSLETIAHTGNHEPMLWILTNPTAPAGQAIFKAYPVSDFVGITERGIKELKFSLETETQEAEAEIENINKADAILFKRIKGYQFPATFQDDDDDDDETGVYNERP